MRPTNDSVASFIARLRKAAETCNFGADPETHLRDRFVVGLEDESVERKLLLEEAVTFSKAVQIAANAEEFRGLQQSIRREASISALRQKKALFWRCNQSKQQTGKRFIRNWGKTSLVSFVCYRSQRTTRVEH